MLVRFILLSALLLVSKPDIPGLVEVPAAASHGKTMAILYTGDGGWRTTDRGLARVLANNGIPVVGLNTLRYFWSRRTPDEAAHDFSRILSSYRAAWKKDRVVVIGYSFGADVLPVVLNRIPKPALEHIELLVLLAPAGTVDFEFHLKQWFSKSVPRTSMPVLPELQKLKHVKTLAVCGKLDGEAICRDLPPNIQKVYLPRTGHRLDGSYSLIGAEILKALRN